LATRRGDGASETRGASASEKAAAARGELAYGTYELASELTSSLIRLAYREGRVLQRPGRRLLGFGTAAVLALPHGLDSPAELAAAVASLCAIEADGRPRDDRYLPLGIGALGFDRSAATSLFVPQVVVWLVDDEPPLALVVGRKEELSTTLARLLEAAQRARDVAPSPTPDRFALRFYPSDTEFLGHVRDALRAIAAHDLDKVVLAREVTVTANRSFVPEVILERLCLSSTGATTFSLDGFMGATPELLIERRASQIRSCPLAGTARGSASLGTSAPSRALLLHSAKERFEHALTAGFVVKALRQFCDELEVPDEPSVLELETVSHLATMVRGTLPTRARAYPSVLELLGALHPTPAVGGFPQEAALTYLEKFEQIDRGRYAGPVGYCQADGDGEWWLGIRSATIAGTSAHLLAGVGIVSGSVPEDELAETQAKLEVFLAPLLRP